MSSQSVVSRDSVDIFGVFKGVLWSVVFTLALVLGFAAVLYFFEIEDKFVPIVNQVIRGISILIGCMLSLRGASNGWLKGFFVGVIYLVCSFLIFSVLNQSFEFGMGFLNDIVLGGVFGLVSGIICANFKK